MNKKTLRKRIPESLVKFLKKKKILTVYLNNVVNHYNRWGYFSPEEDIYNRVCSENVIKSTFIWFDTKEGDLFWRDVHAEYKKEFHDSNRV